MGVLSFNGSTDQLKWTSLTATLADVSDGAWTMAAVCRMGAGAISHFNGFAYLCSGAGAGVAEAGLSYSASNDQLFVDVDGIGIDFPDDFLTFPVLLMVAVSKGAGTVIPRLAWKIDAGGSWTHRDASGTLPDQIDATQLQIGTWQDTDNFEGHVGVVAFWEGAMSDANKEALDNNWRTSDLWNSAHGQPKFLVELNVAAGSVVDLAGNASSPSHSGTTLDAAQTLDSWNFDGTGSGAPAAEATYGGHIRRGRLGVA